MSFLPDNNRYLTFSHSLKKLSGLFVLLLFFNCAKTGSPPGGPVDDIPPRILSTAPESNATRVSRATRLSFTFTEPLNRKSFEDAIFITPNPARSEDDAELQFKWRGKTVDVILPDSLREQRTYVVTVGTGVRDRRGVNMKESFALAFSTGDTLDRGEIKGRIFDEKAAGLLVMAYILTEGQEPNPAKIAADYYTQVGEAKTFSLSYLAPGRYRVFALQDRDGDRLYTRGDELIGIATNDVIIDQNYRNNQALRFRLMQEDTLAPGLSAVTAISANQIEWRFDEAVSPHSSKWMNRLKIFEKETQRPLPVFAAYPHPLNGAQILALTAPMQAMPYFATADSLLDDAGLMIDSARGAIDFEGAAQPDTIRPRLVKISIADSTRDLSLDAPIVLFFSEMMKTDSAFSPLVVQDTSGARAAGAAEWVNPLQFRFSPQPNWKSRCRYEIKINADSLFDWNGNALFDTTRQITFWTLNADTLASISGAIADADSTAGGLIHLKARQFDGKIEYSTTASAPGGYSFPGILPGLYEISGFRDANHNGRFDAGMPFPFAPAERYHVWPDTIKVRSRWPNEGNDLVLP
ncbi:hypothetical protein DCC62_29275 [candidate division KSB1 bacterium]|nr:MAG: hypothetical protein DCC62_29275 [candidate division KSB1 bacterium]